MATAPTSTQTQPSDQTPKPKSVGDKIVDIMHSILGQDPNKSADDMKETIFERKARADKAAEDAATNGQDPNEAFKKVMYPQGDGASN